MVKRFLYIEGEPSGNGQYLRQAFIELIGCVVANKPRIVLGGNDSKTAQAFSQSSLGHSWALFDMDGDRTRRNDRIQQLNLEQKEANVFFMVQKMEAWFLSQPDVLQNFYELRNIDSLKNKKAEEIRDPVEELIKISKKSGSNKGRYLKLKHDIKIIPMLNARKLIADFPDFKNLINALNK